MHMQYALESIHNSQHKTIGQEKLNRQIENAKLRIYLNVDSEDSLVDPYRIPQFVTEIAVPDTKAL